MLFSHSLNILTTNKNNNMKNIDNRLEAKINPEITTYRYAKFKKNDVQIIVWQNEEWITIEEIAKILEITPYTKLSKIFLDNNSLFSENNTNVIKLRGGDGKAMPKRIFNRKGAWLLTMESQSKKSKDFRKWILRRLKNNGKNTTKESVQLNKAIECLLHIDNKFNEMNEMNLNTQNGRRGMKVALRDLSSYIKMTYIEINEISRKK